MRRRRILRLGLAATAWFALTGHTPYRQWKVYRQKHLLIGSCKTDPESFTLAKRIAQTLLHWLPESSARASRAPDQRRIGSLLASSQWQVSVLGRREAADLSVGRGLFETVGAVPLHSLFAMGEHLLVCRPDFPDRHAWLVAATLSENSALILAGSPAEPDASTIPVHPGARAHGAGAPLPPAPVLAEPEAARKHSQ